MLTLKGATLLHVAAEFGQAEVAGVLLDAGADVDAAALTDSNGLGGQSAIFHAATQNADFGLEVVRRLIAGRANLNIRCRLPGHYERADDLFEGTVLDYARRFPGVETETVKELRRAVEGHR
jgi:ankyrin repeat protein